MMRMNIDFMEDDRILISKDEPFRFLFIEASCREEGSEKELLIVTDFSKDEEGNYRIYPLVAEKGNVRNPCDEEYLVILKMVEKIEESRGNENAVMNFGKKEVC